MDLVYEEDVHRLSIPKALDGERLGLTVQYINDCIVVTRIFSGGLIEKSGDIQLGDIILEVNNIPIKSAEDLGALIQMSVNRIQFVVKRTPQENLKKLGIPSTPSLRKSINEKNGAVLCYVKALFDYEPYEDSLIPCSDAGLCFSYGDILAIDNQDDPNWWQARPVEYRLESAKLIPSRELEERRKAFVYPEANYTSKIGLCGTLISRQKKRWFYRSNKSSNMLEFDRAELQLYEEVILMKPFKRKTLVLIGASGVARRILKRRLIEHKPDVFGLALPHTSRPKRPEEDNGSRYWFVDKEDMQYGIRNHEFLEYGELKGNLYGTKLDSIRSVIDSGKTCILDCSPSALKLLHFSSEFMPYVIFLTAPGLDEMRHVYENRHHSSTLMPLNRTLGDFERTSSIRHSSHRAKTMSSLCSLYVEEDLLKNLEDSAKIQRAYCNYFDLVVIDENHEDTFKQVVSAWEHLMVHDQWVPSCWIYS